MHRQLRAAGLGGAGDNDLPQNAAALRHTHHTVPDGRKHAFAARHLDELRRVLPDRRSVGSHGAVGKMQQGTPPAVGKRRRVGCQLHGRQRCVALPDGCHQGQPGLVVFVARPGQPPGSGGGFHPGVGSQPQLLRRLAENIHPQPPPDIIKKDVAAVLQGGAQVHRAAVAVLQAAGLVAAVIEVAPRAVDGIIGRKPLLQRGGSHGGLKGGAGRIQPLAAAVQQRGAAVGAKVGVVAAVGVQVVAWVVGGG